jgi:hypothetical protein
MFQLKSFWSLREAVPGLGRQNGVEEGVGLGLLRAGLPATFSG